MRVVWSVRAAERHCSTEPSWRETIGRDVARHHSHEGGHPERPRVVSVRIGVRVPNAGPLPAQIGIPAMARAAEAAGFESLWVSDHVVMPQSIASRYPFTADGRATWPATTPYFDALIALALIVAVTDTATVGTAALVLPLRHPIVVAKQLATIDAASGGRLRLGAGAGWLREEFEALDVPFESRGARLGEWLGVPRGRWARTPPPRNGGPHRLPARRPLPPPPAPPVPGLL